MNEDEKNIIKKRKFFLIVFGVVIFSFLFLNCLVSAEIQVGTSGDIGVDLNIPTPINYSLVNVNNSLYWGGLETPANILHSLLDNLEWSVAGHTMDTNLDMDDNNIINIDKAYFGASVFLSSDDANHLDIHSNYIDLHGNLSTIWEVHIQGDGDGTDSPEVHGELVFGSRDAYIYYNGTDFIIDPDAIGSGRVIISGDLQADNFYGSGAYLTDLNVTGILNVTGDFTGYAINISYLYGALGVGGMDMRGDPWYLSGTDLQIADNLLVDGNVTASYFNGINISNLGDTYVPYTGANQNVDLGIYNITYGAITNSTLNQIYVENTEEEYIIWI